MKFLVLSLFVLGCSALPQTYNSYNTGARYGGLQSYSVAAPVQQYSTGFVQAPVSTGYLSSGFLGSGYGLQSGYSGLQSGYSGLQSGLGLGYGQQLVAAAPVATIAAPVSTQVITAAPAIATVAAAPAIASIGIQKTGLAAGQWQANNNFGLLNVQQGEQFQQVVPAAIQQVSRTVEYKPIPYSEQPIQAQVVEIEPSDNPVHLHFKSRSSSLSLSQSHTPLAAQETQVAQSADEPSRLITEVQKPVVQEVREVISPYRQVTQEINPVVESLHTVVTKGEGQRQQYQAQQYQGQQYQAQQFAAPAVAQVAYAQPALQQFAIAQPAVAQVSAPIALQTVAVPAPIATGSYSAFQSAPIATGSYSTFKSAPLASSSFSSFKAVPSTISTFKSGYSTGSNLLAAKPLASSTYSSSSSY